MRLFAAITLSEELKKGITSTLHDLKIAGVKGSYVPLQNLHVTLAFIGEVKNAETVKDALRQVSVKPFRLTISDMGSFGSEALYAGVKGNQGLSGLAKAVRDALDTAGIGYDRKKFTPHITLVRRVSGTWKSVPAPKGEMMVKKFSLMKSELKDGKRVYTEIFSAGG